jgi:HNH endonuclease
MEYQGMRHPDGYGYPTLGEQRFKPNGSKNGRRQVLLHRWVMEQALGRKLRSDEVVRHICDNPPCFLLAHLRRGTQDDNIQDMVDRGTRRGEHHWNWQGGFSYNYREGKNLRPTRTSWGSPPTSAKPPF